MSSSIFFKFKSQKQPMQINFDQSSLSVFEVKREIISIARLGDGTDFDLEISAPESGEVYDDDTTQIPRSTTVIARRTPALKPGAGRAARYVTGKMPITAKNQHRVEAQGTGGASNGATVNATASNANQNMTEEERLNAMFAADSGAWRAEQSQMTHKPLIRSTFNKPNVVPDKPPPAGYTCFRCGQKGHWIQACPTNTDPNWDRRFKKTTGIPTSMLHKVEKILDEDGKPDFTKLPAGVMVNANGDWMVAAPDKAAWDKFQEKQNAAAEKAKDASIDNQEVRARGLECPLDSRLFNEPVKTPCCGKTFCRGCIENALLDSDLLCPNCGEQVLLDKLEPDGEVAEKVKQYEEEKKVEKQLRAADVASSPAGNATTPKATLAVSPRVQAASPVGSPSALARTSPPAALASSRKRSAEDTLESDRSPPGIGEVRSPKLQPALPTGSTTTISASDRGKGATPASSPANSNTTFPSSKQMEEFARQMTAMSGGINMMQQGMMSMPGMGPMMNMPGMINPMMNPMMNMPMMPMNMGMNMGMGMGMGFGGGNGMNGHNMNMYNGGGQPGQSQPNWNSSMMYNGPGYNNNSNYNNNIHNNNNGNGNDGAYFRQPVNPHRQQGRQRRQRSVDYKQM